MAEYSAIAVQTVNPGESIVFTELSLSEGFCSAQRWLRQFPSERQHGQ